MTVHKPVRPTPPKLQKIRTGMWLDPKDLIFLSVLTVGCGSLIIASALGWF